MQLIAISGKFNTVRHPHTVVTDGERADEPGLTFRGQSTTMSASDSDGEDEEVGEILQDDVSEHLQGIEDRCGCAEMWEFLSDRRHEGGDSGEWGQANRPEFRFQRSIKAPVWRNCDHEPTGIGSVGDYRRQ